MQLEDYRLDDLDAGLVDLGTQSLKVKVELLVARVSLGWLHLRIGLFILRRRRVLVHERLLKDLIASPLLLWSFNHRIQHLQEVLVDELHVGVLLRKVSEVTACDLAQFSHVEMLPSSRRVDDTFDDLAEIISNVALLEDGLAELHVANEPDVQLVDVLVGLVHHLRSDELDLLDTV